MTLRNGPHSKGRTTQIKHIFRRRKKVDLGNDSPGGIYSLLLERCAVEQISLDAIMRHPKDSEVVPSSPGAELAAVAGRRRCGRSRDGAGGGSGAGLAGLAVVLLGARGCRRRFGGCGCLRVAGVALSSVRPTPFRPRAPLSA